MQDLVSRKNLLTITPVKTSWTKVHRGFFMLTRQLGFLLGGVYVKDVQELS